MKKSLSFAAITVIVFCSFSVSNLKIENKNLAVIIIAIPPMHLSAIYSRHKKTHTKLNYIRITTRELV
jgi:hypothetical protein